MIDASNVAIVMQSAIAVLGLSVGWFFLRADFKCDLFRQRMFALRDEMFDYARSGAIPFDHPAYLDLRMLMNSLIRFAHRLTIGQVLVLLAAQRIWGQNTDRNFSRDWEKSVQSIADPEVRKAMLDFRSKMGWMIIKHLMMGSPFTAVISVVVALMAIVPVAFRNVVSTLTIAAMRAIAHSAIQRFGERTISSDFVEQQALNYAA